MYKALPRFRDAHISEKPNLFIKKLRMCCVVFDFSNPSHHLREKEIKRQTLLELVDYVISVKVAFNDVDMQELTKMVAVNLFRTFPSDNEEPSLKPAWPHIHIVYELLLRFVTSSMADTKKLAKRYIDQSFILKLLNLFDSEDPREREYMKTIMHRLYEKFIVHRPYTRKTINTIFDRFIFETEKHNGIAELLEILGFIISGFALPLKEEHTLFLERALIPLHKPKCVSAYHPQLSNCILQFLEKDFELAYAVITSLLEYWPVTDSSKEVMFLVELEEILKATQATEFQLCMVPLFQQISLCLTSSHFQVAEKALFLWNDDHIRNLIAQNHVKILSIVYPALERNKRGHWNKAVRRLTPNARKAFRNIAGIVTISVDNPVEFTLEELAEATNNFNLSYKIGQGGFGAVYYAELRGKRAAIKKMDMEASKEFLAEQKVLTRVHHVNLVRLIGYCVKESLFLVYEYVQNGNLQQHLHGSKERESLPWTKRVQIALDSARALEYIHDHSVPAYVHRDIKSANILIDKSFRAKVADFGLAKLAVDGGSLTRPMGTVGYMAPEIVYGEISTKVDVYAFGVVLFELISGKDAIFKSESGAEFRALVNVFEEVFKERKKEKAVRKIIDPRLEDNYPFDSVYKMAKLGRDCTQRDAQLRPSMSNIVVALSTSN